MARHEHLPIYKTALDMTVHFEKIVAGFSRYLSISGAAQSRSSLVAVHVNARG